MRGTRLAAAGAGRAVVLLTFLLAASCSLDAGMPDGRKARWVFVYDVPASQPEWAGFCRDLAGHGFNGMVLSISDAWIGLGAAAQAQWMAEAKAAGLSSVAMVLESTSYIDGSPDGASNAAAKVEGLVAWNAAHADTPWKGMVVDIEPHALFSSFPALADRQALCVRFSDVMKGLASRYDLARSLPTWICTGWWFQRRAADGTYPGLDLKALATGYAGVLPMIYDGIGGSAEDLIAKSADSLAAAPSLIGAGCDEYTSWSGLKAALDAADAGLSAQRNYRGWVVFESKRLRALPGW